MSREENKEIFQDTEKLCKRNPLLIQAWKSSSKLQKLILENEAVAFEKQIYEKSSLGFIYESCVFGWWVAWY